MLATLLNIWNVLLVVLGFGLMIVFHELGHFLAARWAGIRAPAFAVGFGPAICSYRKGMGFRLGSTEPDYLRRLDALGKNIETGHLDGISDTEYRLNWFPLGGYVRMLGQEDANPKAVSSASDSYNAKPVWKRMIVVSAGVIMNLILAAILFIIVFAIGLRDVPAVIGDVLPDSPAAQAGLRSGDVIRAIDSEPAHSFADIQIASALSGSRPIVLNIERPDGERLDISVDPTFQTGDFRSETKMIGAFPAASNRLLQSDIYSPADELREQFARVGLVGVEPGMLLTSVNDTPLQTFTAWRGQEVTTLHTLRDALRNNNGTPIDLTFAADRQVTLSITPDPELMIGRTTLGPDSAGFLHLLGLTPVMKVAGVREEGAKAGLRAGDVFVRIGSRAWPSLTTGISEVRAHAGRTIELVVLRDGQTITINAPVKNDGTIGFWPAHAIEHPFLANTPDLAPSDEGQSNAPLATTRLPQPVGAGMTILAINDEPVDSFRTLRAALKRATAKSLHADTGATVFLTIALLETDSPSPLAPETLEWQLTPDDINSLHELGWHADGVLAQFMTAQMILRATDPIDALGLGVIRTKRVLILTYLTLQRLFSGDVKVQSLRGPVGIADIGSRVARDGFVQLLFFLALISVNLAVINFLPIPIVDGGLFLMLVYEGLTKRPVPIAVQQALTLVGLVIIGSLFLFVTFHDIRRLVFGG